MRGPQPRHRQQRGAAQGVRQDGLPRPAARRAEENRSSLPRLLTVEDGARHHHQGHHGEGEGAAHVFFFNGIWRNGRADGFRWKLTYDFKMY